MKVTKALIEQYHQGLGSPEEREAVEHWLLSDDADDLSHTFTKSTRNDIWDDVKQVLPSRRKTFPFRKMSIAAAVLLCICTTVYFLYPKAPGETIVAGANINTDLFSIQFGNNGKASFDQTSHTVDFCGTIRITPKKNIDLSFKTICSNGLQQEKVISFREGQTYIALNYKHSGASEMLVIDEDLLFELPPVVKNQVSDQFKI